MAMTDGLARSELFGHLESEYLEKLSPLCRGFTFGAGEVIFKEGDEAKELYVLTDGRVDLEIEIRPVPDRPPMPTTVEAVTEDECFGWSAVVEPMVYTASAVCRTPCTVIALRGDILRRVMEDEPLIGHQVMAKLAQMISRRLAHTRMRLTTGLGLILQGEESRLLDAGERR